MYVTRAVYARIVQAIEWNRPLNTDTDNTVPVSTENIRTTTLTFDPPPHKARGKITWINTLAEFVNHATTQGIVKNAIVHGSYGDFTATPFSDLEITLIVSNERIYDQDRRNALRRWLKDHLNPLILTIDPLQHHSAFYLWSDLINRYDERILPISAYQDAWAINPITLTFNRYHQMKNDRAPVEATIAALRNYKSAFFRFGMTPYAIKRMLSNIMLLPAFCYQSRGEMYTKPDAIRAIREDTPAIVAKVLDEASRLRAEWPETPAWLGKLRAMVNRGGIPSGRADLLLTALYRHQSLQKRFSGTILAMIPEFCTIIEQTF